MQLDVSPMSKTAVTRLFIGGVVTIVAGAVLLLAAVWGAFASGVVALGGPALVEIHGGSSAWLLVGLALLAVLTVIGGFAAAVVSWIGALLNTFQLADRTWFVLLLVMGLFSLGFVAMLAYVVAGPDGSRHGAAQAGAVTLT
jgi:hypothetical protein